MTFPVAWWLTVQTITVLRLLNSRTGALSHVPKHHFLPNNTLLGPPDTHPMGLHGERSRMAILSIMEMTWVKSALLQLGAMQISRRSPLEAT